MLVQLENQWRRWRRSLRYRQMLLPVPLFLLLTTAVIQVASGAFPPPPPPPLHYHNQQQQQFNPQGGQPILTGPSVMPPNYYYQIEADANKLVQRQMQPGPGGLTAAATDYLLQQLQNERHQQHQVHRSLGQQPAQPLPPLSPQQQTLQLLASLSPQQISALQTVLPTLPRSNGEMPPSVGHGEGPRVPPSQFASRIGPFDKLFNRAKAWLPDMMGSGSNMKAGNEGTADGVGEPKMRDLHRLPKPPQYPLYDIPSAGQATPPPAPIMHPMASLPNSVFDLDQPQMAPPMQIQSSSPRSTGHHHHHGPMASGSNFNQQNWMSPSPTMSTSRRSRPFPTRPPKPSKSSFLRNPLRSHKKPRPSPEPPIRRNHGPPPRQPHPPRSRGRTPPPITKKPKKVGPPRGRFPGAGGRRPPPPPPGPGPTSDPYGVSGPSGGSGGQMGFEHPMASNLSPAQSPALGRPLSYEEYMARPSHSYTNDPWNFDPFASQMNQGLHTHALRYNYDPLGMNALDTEANSHLDPNKLSYPGDSFNQDMVKDAPGIGSQAQIGGWDKPFKKRPYDSNPDTELTPPGSAFGMGAPSSFPSSPNDPFNSNIPSSLGSSSNRYQSSSSNRDHGSQNSNNNGPDEGTGFLGDSLSGGRRGEMMMGGPGMDNFQGGSDIPAFNMPGNGDDAPTIDLESLSQPQDDGGMDGLEFTIETSMDKGADGMGQIMIGESSQPEPHPLGPMQPAPNPYLSDQYNPYVDASPAASSLPGSPYGPNGYERRERYGRRRTRNNHGRGPPKLSRRRSMKIRPRPRKFPLTPKPSSIPPIPSPTSIVPEGVQIFNEIMSAHHQHQNLHSPHPSHATTRHLPPPQQAVLRRQLYNAIRQ